VSCGGPALQRAEPVCLPGQAGRAGARPVMLATLDVPFDLDAVAFALGSAVEVGQRLVVANVVERAPLPLSAMLGYDDLPPVPSMARSLDEAVRQACSLGVEVIRLRVRSMHPVPALLEVVAEQDPGVLVFGPDRRRISRLRYWRATRAIRSSVTALVWLPELPGAARGWRRPGWASRRSGLFHDRGQKWPNTDQKYP
jgi:nucleotide-binding universal stress UspA family protein